MTPIRVLLVANRTASNIALVDAVRRRALEADGQVVFHLVVPATAQGLHRVVDPEVAGRMAAADRLRGALAPLSKAAGSEVTGHVGDANPLAAVADALNLRGFDEIVISTLPWRLSRWLRIDLAEQAPRARSADAARHKLPGRRGAGRTGRRRTGPRGPGCPTPSCGPGRCGSARRTSRFDRRGLSRLLGGGPGVGSGARAAQRDRCLGRHEVVEDQELHERQ